MWTQVSALLLLACYIWPAQAQRDGSRRQSIWDDPITFNTKDKDLCTMTVTGQGEYTKLRMSCQSNRHSYWCEYVGKPYMCSSYNKNPRHYFVQMMWELRKLHNACQAPREIKPHMCRKSTDDSQMVFSAASFSRSWSEATRTEARQAAQPTKPQPNTPPTTPYSTGQYTRVPTTEVPTQETSLEPTTQTVESYSKRMGRQYCWRSLRGICSFIIGLFRD